MPPRRRQPTTGASSSAAASASNKSASPRPSKLAKEHNITAQDESDIREAFSLFAEPMEGEKEGVIPIGDVRRALIALGIPPSSPSQLAEFTAALDPEDEGFATYPAFVAICALQLHARRQRRSQAGDDDGDGSGEDEDGAHRAELDEAYALFAGAPDAPAITLAHLRRVAALLRLDRPAGGHGGGDDDGGDGNGGGKGKAEVDDDLLRDMILEANDGAGVAAGVRKEEFDGVMRRAGVWR